MRHIGRIGGKDPVLGLHDEGVAGHVFDKLVGDLLGFAATVDLGCVDEVDAVSE